MDVFLLRVLGGAVGYLGMGEGEWVHAADHGHHLGGGGGRGLDQGAQGFGPQVTDGAVDGLVHHSCLDELALFLVGVAGVVVKAGTLLTCSGGRDSHRRDSTKIGHPLHSPLHCAGKVKTGEVEPTQTQWELLPSSCGIMERRKKRMGWR